MLYLVVFGGCVIVSGMDTEKLTSKASASTVAVSWMLVAACAGFIFFMSSNTDTGLGNDLGIMSTVFQYLKAIQTQVLGPNVDIVSSLGHFGEYLALGVLLANALHWHMPLGRACFIAVACASMYGVSDELHQLFVPGRMCDPVDWLVDTVGASLGSGLVYMVVKKRKTISRSEK